MKPIFLSLLAVLFFACSTPVTMENQPSETADVSYIIGYTGGWGGGSAYKLEEGKLYKSAMERGIGDEDAIVATEFKPLKSATGLEAMKNLAAAYSPMAFAGVEPKFDCPEMAYDGVCPYFIIVEDGKARAWTRSKDDADPTFVAFMDEVEEAITKM